jgi:tRNA dimethylallyltransferase
MQDLLRRLSREAPVLIAGPTASGKSGLAMDLAARDGRVIVNADALQVFSCWRVLTARPSVAEEAATPHLFYGHVGRDDDWSVGHWLRAVAPVLEGPRPVVIVGGTMLYFRALTMGLAEVPPVPPEVRRAGDALRASGGVAALLAGLDIATAARIDRANPARVQRAWEVLQATGRGLAGWQADTAPPLVAVEQAETLVLNPGRDWLLDRITRRFDTMLTGGALDEVRAALPHWNPTRPWARAIGAPELVAHLRGDTTLDQAREAAIIATRQYAKRQGTGFRGLGAAWQGVIPG